MDLLSTSAKVRLMVILVYGTPGVRLYLHAILYKHIILYIHIIVNLVKGLCLIIPKHC